MNALKLRATMIGTLAAIIGLSTLFFTVVLSLLNVFDFWLLGIFVVGFNVLQWLIAPYLIDAMYRVRKVSPSEEPELHNMVERISKKSGIKPPEVMVARIPIPNAFAYGSPLTGKRVAVTTGLLDTLDSEEVEAVIGHELGHLKHRDVQVMMFVSILPALFYYIGYSLIWSSAYSRRDERGNGSLLALVGFVSIIFYWILMLFTLYLSRLREYYADRHSATVVDEGARKLSEGLVKIAYSTERARRRYRNLSSLSSMKALFISDPDSAGKDAGAAYQIGMLKTDQELVAEYLSRKVTAADRIAQVFSTHPNLVERLRALQELA
ncbi:MAG: zinc metalloprotease HtpX [Candidatus Bathyarchaeia archaeon]